MLAKLQKHTYDFPSHTEFEDAVDPHMACTNTQVANVPLRLYPPRPQSKKTPPAHPNIIGVQVGSKERDEVILAELCRITPDQCFTRKLPPEFSPSMLKFSSMIPQDPADETPYLCLLSSNHEANNNEPYVNLLSSDSNVDHALCLLSIIKNGMSLRKDSIPSVFL
ncbi:hypothetical protein EV424DRAFT_1545090 [Suillus variegatus]|nr:hypothetical protein EV424DRAFT_1545090 [Suillus variegatus]